MTSPTIGPTLQKNECASALNRTTFRTSRELDFFSEKELTTQTGHPIEEWPCVFLKETIDNALDACEESDISPEIRVHAAGMTVTDNGPGLPVETLHAALDFSVRASSRGMYVAPDRGAQGNALMTLLSMPYVLDPEQSKFLLTAEGVRHAIVCRADPISQRVQVEHRPAAVDDEPGTAVRICWSPRADADGAVVWPFADMDPEAVGTVWSPSPKDMCLSLLRGYTLFNPHLTLAVDWFGETLAVEATDPQWSKWKPHQRTSAHWYAPRHLERLIAALASARKLLS